MQRALLVDYLQDVNDEFVILIIGELTESDVAFATEMGWIVGVASGAAERALAGDFDGE